MIELDLVIPEEYIKNMLLCSKLLIRDDFTTFLQLNHANEYKLYSDLVLKLQAVHSPAEKTALIEEFCQACIIAINVAMPGFSKAHNMKLLADIRTQHLAGRKIVSTESQETAPA